jgi:hypothetical protein
VGAARGRARDVARRPLPRRVGAQTGHRAARPTPTRTRGRSRPRRVLGRGGRQFEVRFVDDRRRSSREDEMPGAVWFPGGTLNYAEHALRRRGDAPAIVGRSQTRDEVVLTHDELADQVARAAAGLRRLGVGAATGSSGTCRTCPRRWSRSWPARRSGPSGPRARRSSASRRRRPGPQIEPKVLLVVDGYRYGTKAVDRADEVAAIRAALPTLAATVLLPYLDPAAAAGDRFPDVATWDELVGRTGGAHLRAGAVRPPAVRALQLGDHRAAEGDRARPRRHPARAPQGPRAAPRPRRATTSSAGSPPPGG